MLSFVNGEILFISPCGHMLKRAKYKRYILGNAHYCCLECGYESVEVDRWFNDVYYWSLLYVELSNTMIRL